MSLTTAGIAHEIPARSAPALASAESLQPASGAAVAKPRLEIVVKREKGDVVLYVDDYATNTPVTDVQVDLQMHGRRLRAAHTADGLYLLPADLLDGDAGSPATVSVRGDGFETVLPVDLPPPPMPTASKLAPRKQIGLRDVAQSLIALVGMVGVAVKIIFMWRRRTRIFIAPRPS